MPSGYLKAFPQIFGFLSPQNKLGNQGCRYEALVSQRGFNSKGNLCPKQQKNTVLIAGWTLDQNPSIDPPHKVRWSNGSPATHNDYLTHPVDTYRWIDGIDGMELHMFLNIIADVRCDDFARIWIVSGVGVTSAALDLTDPKAPDDQIRAELYTYPIVYQARISNTLAKRFKVVEFRCTILRSISA